MSLISDDGDPVLISCSDAWPEWPLSSISVAVVRLRDYDMYFDDCSS